MKHKQEPLINGPIDPASTDEGRISQITSLAYDAVEKRIREGTASAMELVYFLKLGSEKTKLEQQKLESETRLQQAKIEALKAQAEHDDLYMRAINAMKSYKIDDGDEEYE